MKGGREWRFINSIMLQIIIGIKVARVYRDGHVNRMNDSEIPN